MYYEIILNNNKENNINMCKICWNNDSKFILFPCLTYIIFLTSIIRIFSITDKNSKYPYFEIIIVHI